ncbi:MAG: lyase family protein, partial [Nitrospira sp.]
MWSGRFRARTHRLMDEFGSSLAVDRRLYKQDIQGSIAHCKGLEQAGVLTAQEVKAIIRGLEQVRKELDKGRFPFAPTDEDIHMAIERRLTQLIGPVGGKLHTGRSRNDQVTLDLRLYLRDGLAELGLGGLGRVLSLVFAVMCIGASFGGGNMFQANQSFKLLAQEVPALASGS